MILDFNWAMVNMVGITNERTDRKKLHLYVAEELYMVSEFTYFTYT